MSQARLTCAACGHADNADHNAARVLKARGIRRLREHKDKAVFKTKKTARVRGKNKVGPLRPEPGCLGNEAPTPVNMSDGVGGQAANDAAFVAAGNRHRSLLGGR